jgi:hypothetical protein
MAAIILCAIVRNALGIEIEIFWKQSSYMELSVFQQAKAALNSLTEERNQAVQQSRSFQQELVSSELHHRYGISGTCMCRG